jgi:hypothetical protein
VTARGAVVVALAALAVACSRGDRERQLAECVSIYRTTYVAGQVRDCLVQRHGWSRGDAQDAERDHLGRTHPDSAALSDSGRMGDSAR